MAFPAHALTGAPQALDHATLKLISAGDAAGTAKTAAGGLALDLEEGWHAYWRMPGEGGLAPVFDWSASRNVGDVTVRWPVPKRFETLGLYSFGYEHTVLFPVDITVKQPGQPVSLALKAEIMVCRDICIPQHFNVTLDIPAGPAKRSAEAGAIEQARKALAHTDTWPALRIDSAVLGPKALVVRTWSKNGYDHADLLAEVKDGSLYLTAPPAVTPDTKEPRAATLSIAPPEGTDNLAKALMNHTVTLTLIQGNQAVEKTIDF